MPFSHMCGIPRSSPDPHPLRHSSLHDTLATYSRFSQSNRSSPEGRFYLLRSSQSLAMSKVPLVGAPS